jgi:copper transport protein
MGLIRLGMRVGLGVLVLVIGLGPDVRPARAHADLIQSTPAANAQLAQGPAQVELIFTEPLEPAFSLIEVLNDAGQRVDIGDVLVRADDPTRMTVSLRSLPTGVYTVSWRALSTADGHLTSGAFVFAVGSASLDGQQAGAAGQTTLQPAEVFARLARYVSLAALIGGLGFSLWATRQAASHAWRTVAQAGAGLYALALLIGLVAQTGKVIGQPLALPWDPAAFQTLTGTRFGLLWTLQATVVFALALTTYAPWWPRLPAVALGLALTLGALAATSGHAAALTDGGWALLAAIAHVWGAALWVGGLGALVMTLRATPDPTDQRAVMRAFTPLAVAGVVALTVSGAGTAWQFVGSWELARTTAYGGTLIGKLFLVAVMLALGAWHSASAHIGTRPLSTAGSVRAEAALGLGVLVLAAILTVLPTASAPRAEIGGALTSDDLTLTLTVRPGRVGQNDLELVLRDGNGPLVSARSVRVRFSTTSGRVAPSEVQLVSRGDGTYTARTDAISTADTWQLQTIVRRDGAFDTFANFTLALDRRAGTVRWLPYTSTALIALALVALVTLAVIWPPTSSRWWGCLSLVGPAVLATLGAFWVAQPAPVDAFSLTNPVAAGPASIAGGRALYEANCLACHGPTGAGDGPLGLALNPRPADLRAHAVPGVHPDGQLYLWISDGLAGSSMPAFANTLSDEERWHLVNYLRSLAVPP